MAEDKFGFANDIVPPWRNEMTPFHLRIGDCMFYIPPSAMQVVRNSNISSIRTMRQKNSMKVQSGYARTMIEITLVLGDINQINGYRVPGPGGVTYYMDGLRPLLAQFRRSPILPIANEHLNDVHGIYNICLASVTFETTSANDALICRLSMYKTTVTPYISRPDEDLDDMICYPLFRWYYQQMVMDAPEAVPPRSINNRLKEGEYLWKGSGDTAAHTRAMARVLELPVGWDNQRKIVTIDGQEFKPWKIIDDKAYVETRETAEALGYKVVWHGKDKSISFEKTIPSRGGRSSSIYMNPVEGNFTGNFKFWVLDSAAIEEGDIEALESESALVPMEIPEGNTEIVHIAVGMQNLFTDVFVQMFSDPCHQYFGSIETGIRMTIQTIDRNVVEQFVELKQITESYSITLRDEFVSGFVKVENELVQLLGINYCLIEGISTKVSNEQTGLYTIELTLTAFDQDQKDQEKVHGFMPFEKDIDHLKEVESVLMQGNDVPKEMVHAMFAEKYLSQLDLYPDLELPTYASVYQALADIDAQRRQSGLASLNFKPYIPPPLRGTNYEGYRVDPDFYIKYDALGLGGLVNPQAISGPVFNEDNYTDTPAAVLSERAKVDAPVSSGYKDMDRYNEIVYYAQKYAAQYNVDYKLVLAIAKHETQFGTKGAGRPESGSYICGYGVPDSGKLQSQYAGIEKQCKMVAMRIRDALGSRLITKENIKYLWNGGNMGSAYRYASDTNWPNGVWKCYQEISSSAPVNSNPGNTTSNIANINTENLPNWMLVDQPPQMVCDYGDALTVPDHTTKEGLEQIMKMMCHDWLNYSWEGRMVKAYPSFCLVILDEGPWMNGFRTWTNYYTYHSIIDMTVIRDRKNPVDMAIIKLTNIYGALDSKPKYKPIKDPGFWEVLFPRLNEKMIKARDKILEKIDIKAGCRIHLRLGHGSVASAMPVVFNGTIVERDTQEALTIVAQGDGIELIDPILEWGQDRQNSAFNIGKNPWNIFYEILAGRPWTFHITVPPTEQVKQQINTVKENVKDKGFLGTLWDNFKKGKEWQNYYYSYTAETTKEERMALDRLQNGLAKAGDAEIVEKRNKKLKIQVPSEVQKLIDAHKNQKPNEEPSIIPSPSFVLGADNPYGIEHFGRVYKSSDVFIFFGQDKLKAHRGYMELDQEDDEKVVSAYDCMKNVYGYDPLTKKLDKNVPWLFEKLVEMFGLNGFDEENGEGSVQMYIGNKSPWDIFNIVAACQREKIVAIHPYMFRSTLFYGKTYWPIKYNMRVKNGIVKSNLKKDDLEELYKPYAQFWFFNSYQNVVSNQIRASSTNICTNAVAIYSVEGKATISEVVKADGDIKLSLQKTEMFDSTTTQDSIIPNIIPAMETILPFLGWETGELRAKEMCRTHLKKKFREMYQGSLYVLSCVPKPYDIFYLSDPYSKMNGMAEVGRVVIHMGFDTGFITDIKPDLATAIASHDENDYSNPWHWIFTGWTKHGIAMSTVLAKWLIFAHAARAAKNASKKAKDAKLIERLSIGARNIRQAQGRSQILKDTIKGIRGGAILNAARGVAAGTVVGFVLFELAWIIVFEGLLDLMEDFIGEDSHELRIYPLWHKGMPYTAGIDGHTTLIPGMRDPWYYDDVQVEKKPAEQEQSSQLEFRYTAKSENQPSSTGQKPIPGTNIYLRWPTLSGRVTSPYGKRSRPTAGASIDHKGIDIAANTGDPVYAAASGIATVGQDKGYGNYIAITHPGGTQTYYGHLSKVLVKSGQQIDCSGNKQAKIGEAGSTGISTGPHLHFEVRVSGQKIDPLGSRYLIAN